MRTLIFSDTHLPARFDKNLFAKLSEVIESVDKVIINGDFWDCHLTTWNKFLNSKWNQLFPLLKKKHTVYNFGNHDPQRLMDERVNLFSDTQSVVTEIKTPSRTFSIQHGNLLAPTIDEQHPFVLRSRKIVWLSYWFYDFLIHRVGLTFLLFGSLKNKRMKTWGAENLKHGEILICGHSHKMEIDMDNRYINTGLIRFSHMQYLVLEDDTFRLEYQRY